MKNLQLQVVKFNGQVVRTYTINYDETEGDIFTVKLEGRTYFILNEDNKIIFKEKTEQNENNKT
jgi:YHS domain-containing protein